MPKYFKITAISISLILVLSASAFCTEQQEPEELSITTYYPSPYGVYKELRLYPNTSPNDCNANNEGAMYYDNATNQVMVCKETATSTYAWKLVSGGVITTYQINAATYKSGGIYYSQTKQYTCPEGASAVMTYCKESNATCEGALMAKGCSCVVSGSTATLTAYVTRGKHACTCQAPCCPSYDIESSCKVDWSGCGIDCYPNTCQMEFQCGIKQEVGQ